MAVPPCTSLPATAEALPPLRSEVALLTETVERGFSKQGELLHAILEGLQRTSIDDVAYLGLPDVPSTSSKPGESDAPPISSEGEFDFAGSLSSASGERRPSKTQIAIEDGPDELFRESHRQAAELHAKKTMHALSIRSSEERQYRNNGLRCLRDVCRNVVTRHEFEIFLCFMILASVVVAGLQVDASARLPIRDLPQVYMILEASCTAIFAVEILLKWIAFGLWGFFFGHDGAWNAFDFAVVFFSCIELVLEAAVVGFAHMRSFRILRVARALRGIRAVRILRYVNSLRTLLRSIVNTLKALVWTMILLVLIFYTLGIAFTQAAVDHCRQQATEGFDLDDAVPVCSSSQLERYWFSVPRSVFSLFMALTNGVSWIELAEPLQEMSLAWVFVFVFYLTFSFFAVLNVITGVFCHTAIETANSDKEFAVMLQLANKKNYVEGIKKIFHEIDGSGTTNINLHEFERKLRDERLSAYLESIDIDTGDAWVLFSLIDKDASGFIDVEEFVEGCLQLRGPAKAIHVAKMSFENRSMRHMLRTMDDTLAKLMVTTQQLMRNSMALSVAPPSAAEAVNEVDDGDTQFLDLPAETPEEVSLRV
eukprot:TRINITY_DN4287_c0_g1_i2.p1 TRINITY_DN4287_c0_g1~~TRINITY_DN4287_c0_g1_i2.p1  ORF type:complete len:608 (-),score=92.37 TRINITY_DN4287_c0_g1_i2:105-1889(-)